MPNTATPPRSIRFYVMPDDSPQRLHDALKNINRLASDVRTAMMASWADLPGTDIVQRDQAEALVDVIRLSELHRRELHELLTRGTVTVTMVTPEA